MIGQVLHIDLETRSACDLEKSGVYRYAEDPTTQVILFRYRFDDGPIQAWNRGEPIPHELYEHVVKGRKVVAHNAQFERTIWNAGVGKHAPISVEQCDCTMSRAAAMGLPEALGNLGPAVRTEVRKDYVGYTLMRRMCRPRTLNPLAWHEEPKDIERLGEYCFYDVETETQIDAKLPALSARERAVWELDQKINDRGVKVDVPALQHALGVAEVVKARADEEMERLTDGAVSKITQGARLVKWLGERHIKTESLAADGMDELIAVSDIMDDSKAKAVLQLRQSSSKAFKFQSMLDTVCRDGRIRGSLLYHGTGPGRWAGRAPQFHNMKRIETDEDLADVGRAMEILQEYSGLEAVTALELVTDNPLDVLSMCPRQMIIAEPGNELIWGDYSNIEGRLNAWFAGARWKLDAFRAFDEGHGPDLYKVMAGRIHSKHPDDVTRDERQTMGKVPELAGGYQGGQGAFLRSALKAGVMMSPAQATSIKNMWRAENPEIVASWDDLKNAAIAAVGTPGVVVPCLGGKVQYVCMGTDYLFCRLPAGRVIAYASPSLRWQTKIITIDGDPIELNSYGVTYWGTHERRWQKLDLYGGLQCAHVVSGTARDLLVEALFALDAAKYEIVLHIHDEVIAETKAGHGSVEHFQQLMEQPKPWLSGLPFVAKAERGRRYIK